MLPLLQHALSRAPLSLKQWQVLLGHLTSCQYATTRGRLHLRPVQVFLLPLIHQGDARARRVVAEHLIPHLTWWLSPQNVLEGIPLSNFSPDVDVFTDASKEGWGAHMNDQKLSGKWDVAQRRLHINLLEMMAISHTLQAWGPLLEGKSVMINSDNQSVVASINMQGTTRSPGLLSCTLQLFNLVDAHKLQVRAKHIPGVRNVLADQLSRPSRSMSTEWSLHPDIFRHIQKTVDLGVVDLFATRSNFKLLMFVSPYPDPLAWKVDALKISWEGLVAYAFPPPALLTAVVEKIRGTASLRLTLIAPWWPAQTWFPILVRLADVPTPLPSHPRLLRDNLSGEFHTNPDMFRLHVWNVSRGR